MAAAHEEEEAGEGEDSAGGDEAASAGTPMIAQVVGSDGATRRGKATVKCVSAAIERG